MAKICFPHYSRGVFESLAQALKTLKRRNNGWHDYMLTEIVQYNVCYRDYLRTHGIEGLIEHLVQEVTELKNEIESLEYLRNYFSRREQLAEYDIQCYHIKDQVKILSHTFYGLADIIEHREIIGNKFLSELECFAPDEINEYADVHIGELYDDYPTFDSLDACDDRTFQNYIFRESPITEDDMKEAFKTSHGCNFCMVHESIPVHRLPILYYQGDGDYMLLATSK